MKIRTDFVSNSSSSSFIVMDDERLIDFKLPLPREYSLEFVIGEYVRVDLWDIKYDKDNNCFYFSIGKYERVPEVSTDDFYKLFMSNDYNNPLVIPECFHENLVELCNLHTKQEDLHKMKEKYDSPKFIEIYDRIKSIEDGMVDLLSGIIRSYKINISFVGVTIEDDDIETHDKYIDEFNRCDVWRFRLV